LTPPTIFLLMSAPPSIGHGGLLGAQGPPQQMPISFWPIMGPDRNCLKWKDRITMWQYFLRWCIDIYYYLKPRIIKFFK
jgi:hypothetical protein